MNEQKSAGSKHKNSIFSQTVKSSVWSLWKLFQENLKIAIFSKGEFCKNEIRGNTAVRLKKRNDLVGMWCVFHISNQFSSVIVTLNSDSHFSFRNLVDRLLIIDFDIKQVWFKFLFLWIKSSQFESHHSFPQRDPFWFLCHSFSVVGVCQICIHLNYTWAGEFFENSPAPCSSVEYPMLWPPCLRIVWILYIAGLKSLSYATYLNTVMFSFILFFLKVFLTIVPV